MKILEIELVGFKRFLLNEINYFKLTFTQLVQVIIGSNGSGKTSLLYQLFPLPAEAKDFEKDGKKILRLQKEDKTYVLVSSFQPSPKHSFMMDEVELNEGGTISVQRELVKEHFGITPEIRNLIMGYEKFTTMSPARRKDWFVKLCSVDYRYAIGLFLRIKDKHRDVTGALKLAKKRLIIEIEKQLKEEESQKLLDEVSLLEKHFEELMSVRPVIKTTVEEIELTRDSQIRHLTDIEKKLVSLRASLKDKLGYTQSNLTKIISQCDSRVSVAQRELASVSQDLRKEKDQIQLLRKTDNKNIAQIKIEIQVLESQINQIKQNSFDVDLGSVDITQINESFEHLIPQLLEIFSEIPLNSEGVFSSEKLQQAVQNKTVLDVKIKNTTELLADARLRLEHLLAHKDKPNTVCPKCEHKFHPQYSQEIEISLQKQIETLTLELETKLKVHQQELDDYIVKCNTYATLYRQYRQMSKYSLSLSFIFEEIDRLCDIRSNPRSLITQLPLIQQKMDRLQHAQTLFKQAAEKQKLVESLQQFEIADVKVLETFIKRHEARIEFLTNEIVHLTNLKKKHLSTLSLVRTMDSLNLEYHNQIDNAKELDQQHKEAIQITLLHQLVKNVQSNLGQRQHLLQQSKAQQAIIANIEYQIQDLTTQEKILSILLKTLSPTEGLIAQGMMGFIDEYVGKMNQLIGMVWQYPMHVVSCSLEESDSVELDYKFPLQVGYLEAPVPDVSMGSKGQTEFCDMAFKIVAMGYLGLTDCILVLDEMGSALDHEHRQHLILLIKSLVEQRTYSQVCMVSHDYSQYTSLPDVDLCVLCEKNVVLPEKTRYNQNTIMR